MLTPLNQLLLSANLIDEIQLRVALQEQSDTGERLGSCLVHLGFIDEAVLAAFLSRQADLPCVNIQGLHIPNQILSLIPKELAFEDGALVAYAWPKRTRLLDARRYARQYGSGESTSFGQGMAIGVSRTTELFIYFHAADGEPEREPEQEHRPAHVLVLAKGHLGFTQLVDDLLG